MERAAIKAVSPHLSGFDLTTALIRGILGQIELSASSKLVLLYFATCYNKKKGKVFPKIKTIAASVGLSEISVKRAVSELVDKGIILKAKKGANTNQYIITNKVIRYQNDTTPDQNDTTPDQNDTSKGIKMILPCHEVKQKEIKQTNKGVAVIPDIILKNPEILNKQAYWRSLDDAAKQGYIDKQCQLDTAKERERFRRAEQQRYFDELDKIRKEPRFYELLNENEARRYLSKMIKIDKSLIDGVIGQYLINKFSIVV